MIKFGDGKSLQECFDLGERASRLVTATLKPPHLLEYEVRTLPFFSGCLVPIRVGCSDSGSIPVADRVVSDQRKHKV